MTLLSVTGKLNIKTRMNDLQECHRSLDAGEPRLTRQPTVNSKMFDAKDPDYIEQPTNLIKGKSMPSLR